MFGVCIFDPWNPTSIQPRSSASMNKICGGDDFEAAYVFLAITELIAKRKMTEIKNIFCMRRIISMQNTNTTQNCYPREQLCCVCRLNICHATLDRYFKKIFSCTKVKQSQQRRMVWYRGTHRQYLENVCSEEDLTFRIFGTIVVKFLACLPLLGFSNPPEMVQLPIFNGFLP